MLNGSNIGRPVAPCVQEWITPQPSRRPDIFPEFEKLETPLPKPLPGDPEASIAVCQPTIAGLLRLPRGPSLSPPALPLRHCNTPPIVKPAHAISLASPVQMPDEAEEEEREKKPEKKPDPVHCCCCCCCCLHFSCRCRRCRTFARQGGETCQGVSGPATDVPCPHPLL